MTRPSIQSLGLLLALAILPLSIARGQNAPRPARNAPPADSTNAMMDAMMPMWGRMMTAMMHATLDVLTQPETAQRMATFTKNYFDALVAKGFTREESLRIVMAVGIPMAPGQR